MKKSTMLAVALVSGSVVSGSQAFADGTFAKGGQMVLSGERLFGLSFTSVSNEDGGGTGKRTDSRTNIALFWPPLTLVTYSPYTTPHLGFDYILNGGLSIGGSLGFISGTGKNKVESPTGASVETDDATITILLLAPRVGYALPLTPLISFWPRGGITYFSAKTESTNPGLMPTTNKTTTTGLGFNIEPMFVFSPADHFGILAGPVVDIPLYGNQHQERTPPSAMPQPDDKVKYMNYGITVGVLGYF